MYEIWMYVHNVPALTVQICRGGWMCGRILAVSCSRRSSPPTSQSHSSGSSSPSVIICNCALWLMRPIRFWSRLLSNSWKYFSLILVPKWSPFWCLWRELKYCACNNPPTFFDFRSFVGSNVGKRQVARQLHLQKCFLHIVYKNCHYSILIVID